VVLKLEQQRRDCVPVGAMMASTGLPRYLLSGVRHYRLPFPSILIRNDSTSGPDAVVSWRNPQALNSTRHGALRLLPPQRAAARTAATGFVCLDSGTLATPVHVFNLTRVSADLKKHGETVYLKGEEAERRDGPVDPRS